jgi:hypothetical protein
MARGGTLRTYLHLLIRKNGDFQVRKLPFQTSCSLYYEYYEIFSECISVNYAGLLRRGSGNSGEYAIDGR